MERGPEGTQGTQARRQQDQGPPLRREERCEAERLWRVQPCDQRVREVSRIELGGHGGRTFRDDPQFRQKSLQEGNSSLSNPKTSPREKKLINLLEKKTPYKDESTYIFNQEKKIANLEKMLKMKKDECERNKMISQELRNKINLYEKRYSGLFYFFEDCLNNFFADEDLERNKDLYINIDLIKKCDFTIFSSEEKYALLVLMMKYLLPLVSLNLNASCNIGNNLFETNLNLINRKFNMTEKYLHDPELRKAFLGKNNKITNELAKSSTSSMFSNSIPVLRKTRSEIDPRLNDPKYKAVF